MKRFGKIHNALMAALWAALGNKGQFLEACYYASLILVEGACLSLDKGRFSFLADEAKLSLRLASKGGRSC